MLGSYEKLRFKLFGIDCSIIERGLAVGCLPDTMLHFCGYVNITGFENALTGLTSADFIRDPITYNGDGTDFRPIIGNVLETWVGFYRHGAAQKSLGIVVCELVQIVYWVHHRQRISESEAKEMIFEAADLLSNYSAADNIIEQCEWQEDFAVWRDQKTKEVITL